MAERKIAFVDKSVVFEATFAPQARSLAPVTFTYKPLTSGQMARFQQGMQGGPVKCYGAIVKLVTQQVVAWDVTDGDGAAVSPANEEMVGRLEHSILIGIADLITDSANDAEAEAKNL
jgi:hypothetical protein